MIFMIFMIFILFMNFLVLHFTMMCLGVDFLLFILLWLPGIRIVLFFNDGKFSAILSLNIVHYNHSFSIIFPCASLIKVMAYLMLTSVLSNIPFLFFFSLCLSAKIWIIFQSVFQLTDFFSFGDSKLLFNLFNPYAEFLILFDSFSNLLVTHNLLFYISKCPIYFHF